MHKNRLLVASGILLFVLGFALVLASFSFLNHYSLYDSRDFAGVSADNIGIWRFPSDPVELDEGSVMKVQVIMNTSRKISLLFYNTQGKVPGMTYTGNFTAYNYVHEMDLYFCELSF